MVVSLRVDFDALIGTSTPDITRDNLDVLSLKIGSKGNMSLVCNFRLMMAHDHRSHFLLTRDLESYSCACSEGGALGFVVYQ